MLTKSHDATYFARMAASLGDKERLLEFISPGKILDVGAGGGELAEALRLRGNEVHALDGSSEAIKRIEENFPEVHAVTGYTHELDSLFEPASFDTVICSSILHEVYSYGDPVNGTYSIHSVMDALVSFFKLLKPGGVLLIRDGIMPTLWEEEIRMELKNSDSVKFLEMYKEMAPFYSETPDFRRVSFEEISENSHSYRGTLASAMEFLFTLTWGWKSAERETQELYGVFTESGYRLALSVVGFDVEFSTQYLQSGYPLHLDGIADIFDSFGNKKNLPSSNAIFVARRP
jgi:SAM-dependent methyltransferase